MSVATKSSDLDNFETEIKIQTEGHTLTLKMAEMARKTQRHLEVPHHIPGPGLQLGNQNPTGPRPGIA